MENEGLHLHSEHIQKYNIEHALCAIKYYPHYYFCLISDARVGIIYNFFDLEITHCCLLRFSLEKSEAAENCFFLPLERSICFNALLNREREKGSI